MATGTSAITVAPQAPHIDACDLCARPSSELTAMVSVGHTNGASVNFEACAYCERAVRRLAAAAGDVVRFVTPAASSMVAVPEAASADVVAERSGAQVYEYVEPLQGPDGTLYIPRVYGAQRSDGTWVGWIEFGELGGAGVLRTNRETSQPNRAALVYWASRLQPSYLEGAFRRAMRPHVVRVP